MSCKKKIDSKLWNEWTEYSHTMESEVRNLRQEVNRTQESLKSATRRCRELARELNNRELVHERERILRDQQLSRLLRALLILEARLKQEQKSIRQLLCEKDNVIRNQQLEIARLRRYVKNYGSSSNNNNNNNSREQNNPDAGKINDTSSLDSSDFQENDSGLNKDIQKLKCEIITRLNENLDESHHHHHHHHHNHEGIISTGIHKTHSFAGSDISKASLTSSENTDASIITTTTEGSPSLLSTEGFCEGESSDVSPGSTLNKSSNRCTPTIITTDSETEVTTSIMTVLIDNNDEKRHRSSSNKHHDINSCSKGNNKGLERSESKDDGMDCNYVSDEDDDRNAEPIYINSCNENNAKNIIKDTEARSQDTSNNNVQIKITNIVPDDQNHDESSGNWYSDPDEDRINEEIYRSSIYRPNSNHNSVLECVNQILLRDMEEEENILSVPRRFKHRGKIVRFQPARLSDIESVGSEMERRNSEETTNDSVNNEVEIENNDDNETIVSGFEATNSEDEFGMKLTNNSDAETESNIDDSKATPIVIIEPPAVDNEIIHVRPRNNKSSSPTLKMERIEEKTCLQMCSKGLTIAKNVDYEDIESLSSDINVPSTPKNPPLPPKPQFRNNTLVLKKIPSPSFLIDETRTKQSNQSIIPPSTVRTLVFEDQKQKNDVNFWKSRFNNVRSSLHLKQGSNNALTEQTKPIKVTNIIRHFEEFKIDEVFDEQKSKQPARRISDLEEDDIRQNFEEFNLDECNLSDDLDRPESYCSESSLLGLSTNLPNVKSSDTNKAENNNTLDLNNATNGNTMSSYDNFLDATGLSNKSILTPSRMLSNHKSMLKPKDVKYKNKIKATTIIERHGLTATGPTLTRHWTGPFV